MNRELRGVSIVVLAMFVALLVSTSIIGAVQSSALAADPRNSFTLADARLAQRGAILVDGKPVAKSVPSDDAYRYQRVYTNGHVYSAVTGFFPVNGAPTGIEDALNESLSGTSGSQFLTRLTDTLTGKHPQGASVELTIDPTLQKAAYDALGEMKGAVVVLQPKTGRILAMVSRPSFDPNALAIHDSAKLEATYRALLGSPSRPLINRAIGGDLNYPGSTFKPIVATAALDSGRFTASSTLPDVAALRLPGTNSFVHNAERTKCASGDTVTITLAMIRSCNIPYAELGMRLGADTIRQTAQKFGFGHAFTIPMRVTPSVYPDDYNLPQTALSAFGQASTRVTPLQMAMVQAAIANNGVVMNPDLVEWVKSAKLHTLQHFTPKVFGRAMSEKTANTLRQIMVADVKEGVASNATIDGVDVGGKTGTSQNGPGLPYTLWFTGFAPAADPQYAIAVVVEDGGGQGQSGVGNTIAAPIAKKVLEAVLKK
jgi:peptidoglycan glycosyltransferase